MMFQCIVSVYVYTYKRCAEGKEKYKSCSISINIQRNYGKNIKE